jgi:predicted RecA/RadA family phage recombinase
MISEMNQGLQFCDLMADTIKSILREIDPDNPLILLDSVPATSSLSDAQKDARVSGTMDALSSAVSASLLEPSLGSGGGGSSSGVMPLPSKDVLASIMKGSKVNLPQHLRQPTNASGGQRAGTVAQDNAQGSTLRKSRKRGSIKVSTADKELVAVIGDHDDNGKKLSKKELSNRLFEATRFRTLHKGDYVAAKLDSRDLWILARVVKQWNAAEVPLKLLLDLSDSKKETLFTEKVLIQEDDLYNEYNGDLSSARAVKRQHIIPLARSTPEGNEWGKRLRKGSRVYAIYPQTTTLYSATVIDCTTYCRNEDDVIIVEFDGDEDEDGNTPQRHILARFVTLVPREFETNAPRKKRKSSSDASRRIVTTTAVVHPPPIIHQGVANGPSSVSNNVTYDDYILAGLMQSPPGN